MVPLATKPKERGLERWHPSSPFDTSTGRSRAMSEHLNLSFSPLAAWRDEECAVVITDCEIGRAMVSEITASQTAEQFHWIIAQSLTLYKILGDRICVDHEGNALPIMVDSLERFSEPISSLPINQLVLFGDRAFIDAHPEIEHVSDEDAA